MDYILCVEMYHCKPSELDEEDARRIHTHLLVRSVINKVKAHNQKAAQGRRRKKR